MVKAKRVREKGKISLSRYFTSIEDGTPVAVTIEKTVLPTFPLKLQGRSGTVAGSKGKYKIVTLKEGNKMKTYTIHPVHLRKL